MKKSKIAAGVVVALAAVWCAGAWFTGKKAEEEYLHQLKQLNQLFAKTEALEESKIFYKNIKFIKEKLYDYNYILINLVNFKNNKVIYLLT